MNCFHQVIWTPTLKAKFIVLPMLAIVSADLNDKNNLSLAGFRTDESATGTVHKKATALTSSYDHKRS